MPPMRASNATRGFTLTRFGGSLALALALAGAGTGTARAQDQPTTPPAPATPAAPAAPAPEAQPKDPGNWKGDSTKPAPTTDPLGGPATPAPTPPAAAADPNLIPNEDPRSARIVEKNYDEAGKIYDNAMKDGESV